SALHRRPGEQEREVLFVTPTLQQIAVERAPRLPRLARRAGRTGVVEIREVDDLAVGRAGRGDHRSAAAVALDGRQVVGGDEGVRELAAMDPAPAPLRAVRS